jgi:stage II sporulation protein D
LPPGGAAPLGAAPLTLGDTVITPAADGLLAAGHPLPSGTHLEASDGGPLRLAVLDAEHHGKARAYRGGCTLSTHGDGRLTVVNTVDLEDYLRGVVPLEIGSHAPPAALAAQAVAARSYALARRGDGTRAECDFDVAGTQSYGGREAESAATDAAVAGTAGQVLMAEDRIVEAAYHACCGGVTAAPEEAWGSPEVGLSAVLDTRDGGAPHFDESALRAWLRTTPDAWCAGHPLFRWTRTVSLADLLARAAAWLKGHRPSAHVGTLRAVSVTKRGPSGRATELLLHGDAGDAKVTGDRLRWVFGDGDRALPSTLMTLESEGDCITVRGAGYGHGVGMCQAGAVAMARAGRSASTILAHYYPGAKVTAR